MTMSKCKMYGSKKGVSSNARQELKKALPEKPAAGVDYTKRDREMKNKRKSK